MTIDTFASVLRFRGREFMVKVGCFGGFWVGVRLGLRVSGFTILAAYEVRVSDF